MSAILSAIVITVSVLVFIVLYNLWSELYEYTGTPSLWIRESVVSVALGVLGITIYLTLKSAGV